jgi:hypothetical protein
MRRRDFLRVLGLGAAAVATPVVLVPERHVWAVPSNAPVGSRLEQPALFGRNGERWYGLEAWLPDDYVPARVPLTPAGRIAAIEDMYADGLISPAEARQLRSNDLERLFSDLRKAAGYGVGGMDTVTIVGIDREAGTITLAGGHA